MAMGRFYSVYLEQELLGKRVKNSKVKITWRFVSGSDFKCHDVVLTHSLYSSKFQVMLDSSVVPTNSSQVKDLPYRHSFHLFLSPTMSTELDVEVSERGTGFSYELFINKVSFSNLRRIPLAALEKNRKNVSEKLKDEAPIIRQSFHEFHESVRTGAVNNVTESQHHHAGSVVKEDKTEEKSLLDLDFTSTVDKPKDEVDLFQ